MNVFTTFKLALRALWRNKVRSMLTMLGIVFGIGTVIAMVAGGQGAQRVRRGRVPRDGHEPARSSRTARSAAGGAAGGAGSRMSLTWDDHRGARERRGPDDASGSRRCCRRKAQVAVRGRELEHAASSARRAA